jgi:hypothetical protein
MIQKFENSTDLYVISLLREIKEAILHENVSQLFIKKLLN